MNQDAKVIHCAACGAALDVEINRAFIFCKYCGCKNIIEEEKMKANINIGGRTNISANTDMESLFNTIDYLISSEKYDQAEEYLTSLFVSGCSDCRSDGYKIMLALNNIKLEDITSENPEAFFVKPYSKMIKAFEKNGRVVFENLNKLVAMEASQQGREVTNAICRLMQYQSHIGLTVLHMAAFYELYNIVVYCVEHGANVNAYCKKPYSTTGLTPMHMLNIGYNEASKKVTMPDGSIFIRSKAVADQIHKYLVNHGSNAGTPFQSL